MPKQNELKFNQPINVRESHNILFVLAYDVRHGQINNVPSVDQMAKQKRLDEFLNFLLIDDKDKLNP
jgi:hypothetical protein